MACLSTYGLRPLSTKLRLGVYHQFDSNEELWRRTAWFSTCRLKPFSTKLRFNVYHQFDSPRTNVNILGRLHPKTARYQAVDCCSSPIHGPELSFSSQDHEGIQVLGVSGVNGEHRSRRIGADERRQWWARPKSHPILSSKLKWCWRKASMVSTDRKDRRWWRRQWWARTTRIGANEGVNGGHNKSHTQFWVLT